MILHPSHHGFRSRHSTCTALLQMQDLWLDALDKNEITAVIMCDMSAAFDLVNHSILLEKLALYGFQESALSWIRSYLSSRSQRVLVDGCLSDSMNLNTGVPQGSILGPLLYICFTNDMPECVHNDHAEIEQPLDANRNDKLYNLHCVACGSICCYADDSTYSKSSHSARLLTQEINMKYQEIVEYMNSNKLVINTEKTHLLVMCSKYSHSKHGTHGVCLNTGSEIIQPVEHEKLLGGYISQDFSWNYHLRDNSKSLFQILVSRVNILSKISSFASFKTRKMIANGIFMSRLVYLIQVWGFGCTDYLTKSLQILQNRAARSVTGLDLFTPVKKLLQQCGWLSINQLVYYHTLVLVFRVKSERKPQYFSDKINI